MNSRFRSNYEVAQQHTYGHDYPIVGKLAYEFAQHITYRHKANVGPCKEEYQTKVGICKTYADPYYLRKAKTAAGYLKNGKYADYRQEGFGHLLKVAWEGVGKELPQLKRVGYIGHYYGRIRAALRTEQQPQHQHGDDRAYRAESYQAEAVFACMAVASDRGDAHAQRHYKGHRHRPGGDSAGIEGGGEKVLWNEGRKCKYRHVKPYEEIIQRQPEKYSQHCEY